MNTDIQNLTWPMWPTTSKLDPATVQALSEALKVNTARYTQSSQIIMSFPGTAVHPIAEAVFKRLVGEHPNHIGLHTQGKSETGFKGTQDLEIEAIRWMGGLLGDPSADGYFNSGGTEANIMGLWIGRNLLLREFGDPRDRRICVFCSFLTHYSIRKACDVLGLGEGSYRPCSECQVLAHFFRPEPDGSGLHMVPTDEFGAISNRPTTDNISPLNNLQLSIERKIGRGFKRFILVANAGTTMTGGVDDIAGMGGMIEQLQAKHPDVGFYFHVDAAFGGFVGPFLDPPIPCGFAHPTVQSVTIDPHKMGLTAYACGGFLCRQGLTRWIERQVGYVGGHSDNTLCGSRSGAAAVAASLLFRYLGNSGYQQIVRNCMAVTNYLREKLEEVSQIEVYPSQLNILPVAFRHERLKNVLSEHHRVTEKEERNKPGQLIDPMAVCQQLHGRDRDLAREYFRLSEKYTLMGEWLPADLGDLESHPRRIHKVVLMPHGWVRTRPVEVINGFVADVRKLLAKA